MVVIFIQGIRIRIHDVISPQSFAPELPCDSMECAKHKTGDGNSANPVRCGDYRKLATDWSAQVQQAARMAETERRKWRIRYIPHSESSSTKAHVLSRSQLLAQWLWALKISRQERLSAQQLQALKASRPARPGTVSAEQLPLLMTARSVSLCPVVRPLHEQSVRAWRRGQLSVLQVPALKAARSAPFCLVVRLLREQPSRARRRPRQWKFLAQWLRALKQRPTQLSALARTLVRAARVRSQAWGGIRLLTEARVGARSP